MKIYKIKWDTDGMSMKSLGLPRTVDIDEKDIINYFGIEADENGNFDKEEILDYVADYLSDEYGYCIESFNCK